MRRITEADITKMDRPTREAWLLFSRGPFDAEEPTDFIRDYRRARAMDDEAMVKELLHEGIVADDDEFAF